MSAAPELPLLLLPLALLALQASLCRGACVEVDSNTEAKVHEGFKLGCISCKMRGEVRAVASVQWHFKASNEVNFSHEVQVRNCSLVDSSGDVETVAVRFLKDEWKTEMHTRHTGYEDQKAYIIDTRFEDRLDWNGSKHTKDLQDGSIFILNVTFNDTGTYKCIFNRILVYPNYEFETSTTKIIVMNVVPQLTRGLASILSEVMMYVSIIGLQLWLVVEMIYCYRKISAAGEEALRESAAEYLAIASESKDNCASVQVAE